MHQLHSFGDLSLILGLYVPLYERRGPDPAACVCGMISISSGKCICRYKTHIALIKQNLAENRLHVTWEARDCIFTPLERNEEVK